MYVHIVFKYFGWMRKLTISAVKFGSGVEGQESIVLRSDRA